MAFAYKTSTKSESNWSAKGATQTSQYSTEHLEFIRGKRITAQKTP